MTHEIDPTPLIIAAGKDDGANGAFLAMKYFIILARQNPTTKDIGDER